MPVSQLTESTIMLACRKQAVPYTPVWLMRQAGRFMPAYRKIREKVAFLELCKNADLAAEVTLLPIQQLGVDAAIIFADILLILEPLGIDLKFVAGDGPVINNPIRKEQDVYRFKKENIEESLSFVFSALKKTRQSLPEHIPLIGFCGAPFTLASYLIEGGAIDNLMRTKTFMYQYPNAWKDLMTILSTASVGYLKEQIKSGANIIQIFDSWLGYLSPADFDQYVLPYSRNLVQAINQEVPVIYFGTGTSGLLKHIQQTDCQVIGVDWRIDLASAWKELDYQVAVQGNLDPIVLLSNKETITQHVKTILAQANNRVGHIFNLGHGVLPNTPIENVKFLVDLVHELSSRK